MLKQDKNHRKKEEYGKVTWKVYLHHHHNIITIFTEKPFHTHSNWEYLSVKIYYIIIINMNVFQWSWKAERKEWGIKQELALFINENLIKFHRVMINYELFFNLPSSRKLFIMSNVSKEITVGEYNKYSLTWIIIL